jgi:hypothetical protein
VSGSGEIWLADGVQYKFVLKDANDVLIATYDNILGINASFSNFIANQEIQTATANQTVFTLANSYTPAANTLSVFVDGVNQYGPGAAYAYFETNSNTVTFVNGLHVGALVKFTTVQSLTSTQSTTAALVSYTPAGIGAVTTTVQTKLRETVSVADFGAVGDGVVEGVSEEEGELDSVAVLVGAVEALLEPEPVAVAARVAAPVAVPPPVLLEEALPVDVPLPTPLPEDVADEVAVAGSVSTRDRLPVAVTELDSVAVPDRVATEDAVAVPEEVPTELSEGAADAVEEAEAVSDDAPVGAEDCVAAGDAVP